MIFQFLLKRLHRGSYHGGAVFHSNNNEVAHSRNTD